MTDFYIHVGQGTDNNDGTVGPTDGSPILTGGAWTGTSRNDWKLDDWLASKILSQKVRSSGDITAKLYAEFGNAELGAGEKYIYEIGIGLGATQPIANPMYNTAQRPNAIIVRKIMFKSGTGAYEVDPLFRPAGATITLKHEFEVIDV